MNNEPENFDRPIPIARLILVAVAIACIAAILLQNLQPLVSIYFLGRSTIPIPLSLAILAAFLSGAIAAAIANSIANWLSRRNAASADSTTNDKNAEPKEPRRSQASEEKVEDSTTPYPRRPSDRTTKLQDDDDYDDDDDDDDRDEIFVKYIKR